MPLQSQTTVLKMRYTFSHAIMNHDEAGGLDKGLVRLDSLLGKFYVYSFVLFQEEYDPKKINFKRLRQQDLDGKLRTEIEAVRESP